MNNTAYTQLCSNMEQLKLTQMLLHLDEITDFVTVNNLSFTEGLLKLSNYEVDFKEKNVSRSIIKAAAFPFLKEFSYGSCRIPRILFIIRLSNLLKCDKMSNTFLMILLIIFDLLCPSSPSLSSSLLGLLSSPDTFSAALS